MIVVQQIEPDHFDCYRTERELRAAFARFLARVPRDGLVLGRHECPTVRRLTSELACRVETFGLEPGAGWSARALRLLAGGSLFRLCRHGRPVSDIRLPVPGKHNVVNALAAAALAWQCGVRPAAIARGMGLFKGVHRRLEVVGCCRGTTLVDDFAHHPTEVALALDAIRRMFPGRRLWCVFQPHQASRTARLLDGLAASLQNADKIVISEIYRAREPATAENEVTAADLAAAVGRQGGDVAAVHTRRSILTWLQANLEPGDVLVTMGAGDIREICHELLPRVREDRTAG
jgi:UDP-N-acetylmuramate--alanine ligase